MRTSWCVSLLGRKDPSFKSIYGHKLWVITKRIRNKRFQFATSAEFVLLEIWVRSLVSWRSSGSTQSSSRVEMSHLMVAPAFVLEALKLGRQKWKQKTIVPRSQKHSEIAQLLICI
ncbi:unnamed protein product [Knipowitschia caucasica]